MRAFPFAGIPAAVAAVVALTCGAAAAQQAVRIAGTVRDEAGRPIKGATIVAANPNHVPATLTASTDDKGRFGLIATRRGLWTFTIEAPGYEAARTSQDAVAGKSNPPIEVRLQKGLTAAPQPLAGVRAADVQSRIDAAEARAGAGEIDAAVEIYREILSRVPALTSLHFRIGALYERKPDVDRALAAYRQLLAVEPDHERARAAVARLERR
jgi:tetratricopeptide (TPR) repeat protein